MLFYQDDVPAHKAAVPIADICKMRFELQEHPLYSLDLPVTSTAFLGSKSTFEAQILKMIVTDKEVKIFKEILGLEKKLNVLTY